MDMTIKTKLFKFCTNDSLEKDVPEFLNTVGDDNIIDTFLIATGRTFVVIYKE